LDYRRYPGIEKAFQSSDNILGDNQVYVEKLSYNTRDIPGKSKYSLLPKAQIRRGILQ
jgi:hypothetical protein